MNRLIPLIFASLTFFSIISCGNSSKGTNNTKEEIKIAVDTIKKIQHRNDTVIYSKCDTGFEVVTEIKYPAKEQEIIGTILMLHGWNLPANQWCEKTSFCDKALKRGYVLIIPDYNKANYTLELYPQTIVDYKKYPTLTWIMKTQIPNIQSQFGILIEGQKNYVAGISTGARGATLIAYYMPKLFVAAASLSGDFDITRMQDEYLYYSFIGKYSDFPERWEKECFAYDCINYTVPTYIGHGNDDKVSPVSQSIAMYDSIKKYQPTLKLIGSFPAYKGHNYDYWESETDNVLKFFDECK